MLVRLFHLSDLHTCKVSYRYGDWLSKRGLGQLNILLRRRWRHKLDIAYRAIDEIAKNKPDAIIVTGDITSTSLDDEFMLGKKWLSALEDIGCAVYCIPGNHDRYIPSAINSFEKHICAKPFPRVETLLGGTPLLLIDEASPQALFNSGGYIDEEKLLEIKNAIPSNDKPLICASHFPLLSKEGKAETGKRSLRNASELLELLKRDGETLYLHGHSHYPHFQKANNNTWLLDSGSVSKVGSGAFQEIEFQNGTLDSITTWRVDSENNWTEKTKRKKNKLLENGFFL